MHNFLHGLKNPREPLPLTQKSKTHIVMIPARQYGNTMKSIEMATRPNSTTDSSTPSMENEIGKVFENTSKTSKKTPSTMKKKESTPTYGKAVV